MKEKQGIHNDLKENAMDFFNVYFDNCHIHISKSVFQNRQDLIVGKSLF